MSTIFEFQVKGMNGEEMNLEQYKGKVILIINSATECGFTPQYEALQDLYEKYQDKDFVVLDFPCDQFGHQAPGTDHEIASFCSSRFGVTFPMFSKVDVNGENELALFAYLKEQQGFKGFGTADPRAAFMDDMLKKIDPEYASNSDIKWNFTKFLVDRKGQVVSRFEPTDDMAEVSKQVEALL